MAQEIEKHLGHIRISRRTVGKTVSAAESMALILKSGGSCGVMSFDENDYAERLQRILKDKFEVDAEYTRLTKKEPQNPMILDYDKFGEIAGFHYVDQVEVFCGWKFTLKNNQ